MTARVGPTRARHQTRCTAFQDESAGRREMRSGGPDALPESQCTTAGVNRVGVWKLGTGLGWCGMVPTVTELAQVAAPRTVNARHHQVRRPPVPARCCHCQRIFPSRLRGQRVTFRLGNKQAERWWDAVSRKKSWLITPTRLARAD